MRPSTATPFSTALVQFYFLQAISALTLSTFQQINGFSDVCTNAYNTPLTDCSNSDFAGNGCSAKCIGFLDSLTNALEEACAGTSAYPNTLIGLFFRGEGVQTMCPNAGGSSSASGGGNGYGQSGGQNGGNGAAMQSTVGEASAPTTSASTSSTTSSSTTSTSSTPQVAVTSSTTTVVPTTVTPEPTTTSIAVVGTTVKPESPSDSSTSTSHTKSSTSSAGTSTSTSNDNGGGTPLDVGSPACHDAAVNVWLFALLAGSAGAIWLL